MATGRREEGIYWRWNNRGGTMGGYQLPAMATMMALGPYQPAGNHCYVNDVDSEMFQLSYQRPRFRWTPELHNKFVEAVNQLGGPQDAKPKAISHIMRVEGLTLHQIKSHLQKYRIGMAARRLLKRDSVPLDFSRRKDESLPLVNLNASDSSISFDARDVNGDKTLEAENYGNMHLLVEPQTAVKNMETTNIPIDKDTCPSVMLEKEEFDASKPVLLPLLPVYEREFLDEVDKNPVAALTDNGPSMDDFLGYYSSELALTGTYESSRASMMYGNFFDEVASFSKTNYDDLTMDHSVLGME